MQLTRSHSQMCCYSSVIVVRDWKNAEIVPIPKKGDLKHCDNWRGISFLDVVGKVLARIIAERVLPESQCGLRKGRGCVDMIFSARQLVEKYREHDDSLFILFVDLKKAYDSNQDLHCGMCWRDVGCHQQCWGSLDPFTMACPQVSEWMSWKPTP